MTHEEFFESLNGFDEIAIQKAFGAKPIDLSETDKSALLRSLVFVAKKRDGLDDKAAKQYAMEATFGELNSFFAEDREPTPETPETEEGKGELPPWQTPSGSHGSASEQESSHQAATTP